MNDADASYDSFRSISQSTSPQTRRNTKNLSLQLNKSNTAAASTLDTSRRGTFEPAVRSQVLSPRTPLMFTTRSPRQSQRPGSPSVQPLSAFPTSITNTPTTSSMPSFPAQPTTHQLYRHPSISRSNESDQLPSVSISRRATLSLAIPADVEISKSSSGSKPSSTNSIPSFSSSSPITSSPLVPATPKDSPMNPTHPSSTSSDKRSSHSSSSTLRTLPTTHNQSGDVLKTQTLIRDLSSFQLTDEGDQSKMNAYPDGPACVLPPNLFLYSEPKLDQISDFDLVVNVARELNPPIPSAKDTPLNTSFSHYTHDGTEYYYVPWTHTSKLCPDLPFLTDLISSYLNKDERVLIHCQCGVSRSASLIVALFMKMNHIHLNEAYNMLKERAPEISPNMSLIFQLMEWGELIGVNGKPDGEYMYVDENDEDLTNHDDENDEEKGAQLAASIQ